MTNISHLYNVPSYIIFLNFFYHDSIYKKNIFYLYFKYYLITERATHSEIEKRRRQKMNKHLSELALHLPGVNQKNKKPDKLTILKLAVQHLRNLKGSIYIYIILVISKGYFFPG